MAKVINVQSKKMTQTPLPPETSVEHAYFTAQTVEKSKVNSKHQTQTVKKAPTAETDGRKNVTSEFSEIYTRASVKSANLNNHSFACGNRHRPPAQTRCHRFGSVSARHCLWLTPPWHWLGSEVCGPDNPVERNGGIQIFSRKLNSVDGVLLLRVGGGQNLRTTIFGLTGGHGREMGRDGSSH